VQAAHGEAALAGPTAGGAPAAGEGDLVLSGIAKSYGGVAALRGVDLVARDGEVHGLIGENGAGKSTLVKILSGSVQPDAGHIAIHGAVAPLGSAAEARAAGVATAFQELSLVPDWDVATNLLYGREPAVVAGRLLPRALRAAARAALASLEIESIDVTARVRDLRLAERQMLEISRALLLDPRILILDEPTSALTPDQVRWCFEAVRSFVGRGRMVLFISHRMEEIQELCSRATVLRDGHDVGCGPIAEMPEHRLVELMLGRPGDEVLARTGTRRQSGQQEAPVIARLERFSSGHAVHDVDLEVRAGEIVGVAGLEGQGQLELFQALYGARRSTGAAWLDGRPLRLGSPAAAIEQGVGLVPSDRGLALCLPLSIRDNVALGSLGSLSRFGLVDRQRQATIVGDVMTSLRVRARTPGQAVETLSGGNQQKVLLGRVLARRPRLLLMYDATRGVDVGTKAEIFRLMDEQAGAGVGILFYSTDVTELMTTCERVIVMHDGRVRAELAGGELTQERIVGAAIGGAGHE
jgi:ABC-type sugar transport system ATPase subunit